MKKSVVLSMLLSMAFVSQAHAGRQAVSCVEMTSKKNKIKVYMNFDPSVEAKAPSANGGIVPLAAGANDSAGVTSAQVGLDIPANAFEKGYTGRVLLAGYYDVNNKRASNSGVLGGEPYSSFHGFDANRKLDVIVDLPTAVTGQESQAFKAQLSVQPNYVDQGYYMIDLKCQSTLK